MGEENRDGGHSARDPDLHHVNNSYRWSTDGQNPDGKAFTVFLPHLNGDPRLHTGATASEALGDPAADPTVCLAQHCDWRLPAIGELRTILIGPDAAPGQATTCSSAPCIDPDFAAVAGPTDSWWYWSVSTVAGNQGNAWYADFSLGLVDQRFKEQGMHARAVRTGSCD